MQINFPKHRDAFVITPKGTVIKHKIFEPDF